MAFFCFCVSGGSLAEGGTLSRRTHHITFIVLFNFVHNTRTLFFIPFLGMAFFIFCVSGGSLVVGGALSRRTHHPLRDLGYFVNIIAFFVCLVGHWLGGGVVKKNTPSLKRSEVFC